MKKRRILALLGIALVLATGIALTIALVPSWTGRRQSFASASTSSAGVSGTTIASSRDAS